MTERESKDSNTPSLYEPFETKDGWYYWVPDPEDRNKDLLIGPYPDEVMCARQAQCVFDASIGGQQHGGSISRK